MGKLTYERGTRAIWTHNYLINGLPATTGTTLLFTVKANQFDSDAADTTAIIKKSVTMSGASTNLITINEGDVADTVEPDNYFYDIRVVDSVRGPLLVDEGTFVLKASPTNRLA